MRPLSIACLLATLLLASELLPSASAAAQSSAVESTAQSTAQSTATEESGPHSGFAAAEALYDEGRFEAAMTAARALNTADGLALASRTGLVLIRYFMPPGARPAAIAMALADARRALEIDPGHLESNLQAAIAIGYRGKLRRSIGDAWAGKRYIDNALAYHPESPWALAALGGWHGEVVMEAGRFFAGALFGAGRKKSVRNFRAAIEAEPENIGVRTSFAITLLRFNRRRFEAEALELLAGTISLSAGNALAAGNALDEILLRQSRDLLLALQEGRRDDLKALLERATAIAGR